MTADEARASNEKIKDALALLEEAAKDKKGELTDLVTGKYANVKEFFASKEQQASDAFKKAQEYASAKAQYARDAGTEKFKEVTNAVDEEVHRNPWPYIGGVALGSLLLGFIMGRKN
jgi:ElaB/YqjD/DUF883 family membrane-anchored ribosome-binding protein